MGTTNDYLNRRLPTANVFAAWAMGALWHKAITTGTPATRDQMAEVMKISTEAEMRDYLRRLG